ncbi:hypothetical protein H4R19_000222 [Coemansia spiralis]|nr:hypothetical protein H4R19_000222 [Coemansia spiralis]
MTSKRKRHDRESHVAEAPHNSTTDGKARAARRKEDAELIRIEDAFENVAEVLTLAEPHDSGAKTAAKHSAARIAAEMEKDLKAGTGASGNARSMCFDELEKIDIALQYCDVGAAVKAQTETHTRDSFAVVECKTTPDQKDDTLEQLIQYTRNLYRVQYNRRFAWGLSVCGVDVRAVVMLHDAVLVSPVMRVSTPTGRRRLVELLVNWAVCDDVRAGYDPTVVFDPVSKHYRIQCPDDGGKTVWYRTTDFILPADNVIGRHTRCFVAERENEDGKEGGPNNVVVIKDAFAAAAPPSAGDDGRNEIQLLRKIRETFKCDKSIDFFYPELVRSGDVKLRVGASEMDDNTDAIFSLMGATRQDKPEPGNSGDQPKRKWLEQPYRVHRRLVMRPKGEHLNTAKTEAEIAIALAEAMWCHTAIHQRCQILHRDISLNNILVVYGPDGAPRGLLIDFDYAIPLDNIHTSRRPGRSGTLAYMSIGNLEHTGQQQTALDDWESLLYTLCMWGMLGLVSKQAADDKRDIAKLPIGKWAVGSHEEIAQAKRTHMDSADVFEGSILRNFHESCEGLKNIARELHAALFLHEGCTGALTQLLRRSQ